MIGVRGLLLAAGLLWLAALPAAAHHASGVAAQIRERDMFFEPVDRAAPGIALETAGGHRVSLGDFRGKVVVLDFIYARCKDSCPLQSDLLARAQQQIDRTPMRDRVEFVSVATDTEDAKETAQVMRGYAKKHGFDPANWTFLYRGSGPPDAGIRAAAAYGLKFEVEGDDQMHGVVTHVIDQAGRMRGRFHGLKFDPTDLILFVNALTNEPPGTASERVEAVAAPARGGFAVGFPWLDLSLEAGGIGLTALSVIYLIRVARRR